MKDYYAILEIKKSATPKEIKKAYRRLAALHHPDKNGQSESELFHEINEAYQVLSHKEKKEAYDWELEFGNNRSLQKVRFENFHTASPGNFQHYQKYARAVSMVSLLFCLILELVYFLPPKKAIETVNKVEEKQTITIEFTNEDHLYTAEIYTPSFKIPISSEMTESFPPGSEIKIYRTRIFSIYTKIERKLQGLKFTTTPDYSIYSIFIFLPIILFICSVLGTFYQRRFNPDLNFSLGIVNFMLLIITFVITLV